MEGDENMKNKRQNKILEIISTTKVLKSLDIRNFLALICLNILLKYVKTYFLYIYPGSFIAVARIVPRCANPHVFGGSKEKGGASATPFIVLGLSSVPH